jgi:hypothetical protein
MTPQLHESRHTPAAWPGNNLSAATWPVHDSGPGRRSAGPRVVGHHRGSRGDGRFDDLRSAGTFPRDSHRHRDRRCAGNDRRDRRGRRSTGGAVRRQFSVSAVVDFGARPRALRRLLAVAWWGRAKRGVILGYPWKAIHAGLTASLYVACFMSGRRGLSRVIMERPCAA